ncbi:MAG: D-aminoacyl-tRNA deacylase [archaeon]|jgi:D-aminoacyl-tRNA deacylase
MDKIALVYSIQDAAGMLIAEKIKELGKPDWAEIYEVKEDIIFAKLNKIKEEHVVFLSRHQSESGTKSLTVHMVGNYGDAKYGGKGRELCGALPRIGANYLRALNEKNTSSGLAKQGFVVTMEVTHHGPFTNKNSLFIEIGSCPIDWKNELAAKIIAETIISETFKENKDKVVIGIGGGHYAPDFTKLELRQKYSFGHICPKHMLGELNKELLKQMIFKSNASGIILDWKGLKEHKDTVVFLCEKLEVPYERVQNLLKE